MNTKRVSLVEADIDRDQTRKAALERIGKLRRPLPSGFKFDREDANKR